MREALKLGVLPIVVIGLVAAGCSSDARSGNGATATAAGSDVTGEITVSDAASLTKAFEEIGADFTTANPDASVTFNPGSSGTLATQIQQTNGVGVDTFASADAENMDELVAASLVDGDPVVFARNKLVIVTKPGNPNRIKTLADLAKVNAVSLCGEAVPCGKYAAQILQAAGVTIPQTKITRGLDATSTTAAVTHGDADAAIVYVTDAKTAGRDVVSVPIRDDQNVIALYPIATLTSSGNKGTSQAFIDYLMTAKGQATLQSYGFLPPS